jgi:hypothetical protein
MATQLFANVFTDGAVLAAAPAHARLWGFSAISGATVSVLLDGATVATATAGGTGRWEATLFVTSGTAAHTVAATSGANTQTISNVLFGRTFICGGQSNMDLPLLSHSENDEESEWGTRYDTLRLLRVGWWHAPTPQTVTPLGSDGRRVTRSTANAEANGEAAYVSMIGQRWHTSTSPSVANFSAT